MTSPLDDISLRLLRALKDNPKASHTQLANAAEVARGTVYARLRRLESQGVITSYAPDIEPAKVGFKVRAFTTLEIRQGSYEATVERLTQIPEILTIHSVTGPGDIVCQIVARTNDHLSEVLQKIASIPPIIRSQSQLVLSTSRQQKILDIVTNDI